MGNRVSGNAGIGIMVAGEDPDASLTNTVVSFNRISNEPEPIVNYGDTNTKIVANNIS